MTAREIGERVKQRRELAGLPQHDLCGPLNMTRPTYIAREKGRTSFTSTEIVAIAGILKCQVSDLVSDVQNIRQAPSLMLAAGEACRLVHDLDAGEITEGRFAKSIGCDIVTARNVASQLRVAASVILHRGGLYTPAE